MAPVFIYLQLTCFFKQSQSFRYKNRQLEFPPGDFRLASEFLRFVDDNSAILHSVVTMRQSQNYRPQHLSYHYAIHLNFDRQNHAEYEHHASKISQTKTEEFSLSK